MVFGRHERGGSPMFLLQFTSCTIVDGVPLATHSRGLAITGDTKLTKMFLCFLFSLIRQVEYKEQFSPLSWGLHTFTEEYRKLVCEQNGGDVAKYGTIDGITFERILGSVWDRTHDQKATDEEIACWLIRELDKPVPCGVLKVV